jgi:hypothetical protein
VVDHPDINECQGFLEPVGKGAVGRAGFGLSGRVIVRENDRGRVVAESFLDHFPGMDGAAVDSAVKELFESERPVAVIEKEGDEHFTVFAGKLGDQVALDVPGAGEGFLAKEPPLELLTDKFEHLVDRHRPEEVVFARALGRLEGRGVRGRTWSCAGDGEIERELRRFARLPGKRDVLRLLPGLVEEVFRKEGEVPLQPVAGSQERLMETGERLAQRLAILRIGGIEGGKELPDGLGCGGGAITGQGGGIKRKGRPIFDLKDRSFAAFRAAVRRPGSGAGLFRWR